MHIQTVRKVNINDIDISNVMSLTGPSFGMYLHQTTDGFEFNDDMQYKSGNDEIDSVMDDNYNNINNDNENEYLKIENIKLTHIDSGIGLQTLKNKQSNMQILFRNDPISGTFNVLQDISSHLNGFVLFFVFSVFFLSFFCVFSVFFGFFCGFGVTGEVLWVFERRHRGAFESVH